MPWFAALLPAAAASAGAAGGAAAVGAGAAAAGASALSIAPGLVASTFSALAPSFTAASIGLGAGATTAAAGGLSASTILGGISSIGSIASSLFGAKAKSAGAESEARWQEYAASVEAQGQLINERRIAAGAPAGFAAGGVTGATPLMVEMENARNIQRHYDDRILQGRIGASASRAKKTTALIEGTSGVLSGITSLATVLARHNSFSNLFGTP